MNSGNPNGRICLELSRGNWIAIAVILGVGLISLVSKPKLSGNQKFAFGSDTRPTVERQIDSSLDLEGVGIRTDQDSDLRFYEIRCPEGRYRVPQIRFVDTANSSVGWIDLVAQSELTWPPSRDSFPDAYVFPLLIDIPLQTGDTEFESDESQLFDLSVRRQVQTYGETTIEWVSPKSAVARPCRCHLGRIDLDDRAVIVTIVELGVTSATSYQSGVFRTLMDHFVFD